MTPGFITEDLRDVDTTTHCHTGSVSRDAVALTAAAAAAAAI